MKKIICLILLSLSGSAAAEIVTFVCQYEIVASPDGLKLAKDFKLTFIVDNESDKAYMLGNLGTEDVLMRSTEEAVNFIEITDAGNIMLTTIDASGFSVHSRHTVMFGEIVSSQYYGNCESS